MKGILLALVALALCACSPKTYEQADKDNDFEALVGDFKVYDACYEKSFKGDECDRWRVKDVAMPEYWPFPEVPAMKWPDAPKERVYKKGMKRSEYFDALCKSEAGEFIYKRVEADSIYQIRPRKLKRGNGRTVREPDPRYADEDWHSDYDDSGYRMAGNLLRPRTSQLGLSNERSRGAYLRYETPVSPITRIPENADGDWRELRNVIPGPRDLIRRYEAVPSSKVNRPHDITLQFSQLPESRYGYTWRGIRRPYDREHGLSGTEVAVVDLKTNEVLALKRGFVLAAIHDVGGITFTGGNGKGGGICPNVRDIKGRYAWLNDESVSDFVREVVQPPAEFLPLWDRAREGAKRRHSEAKAKDPNFDLVKAYEASESFNRTDYGYGKTYEQYLGWLRERGLPIDEYLAKKQAIQSAAPAHTDSK